MKAQIKRKRGRPAGDESDDKERQKRQEYMHDYYIANREKALAYSKQYNTANRRSIINERKRQEYALKYAKTGKKQDRAEIVDVYNPSSLMNLQPEKLEKAVNRILRGVCDYVGAR